MKRIQKWSALLMAVTLLFTLAAPAALAAAGDRRQPTSAAGE